MSRKGAPAGPGGLIIVDKPSGMTSHDVVSRIRRLAHTRRVGHAGTLDPAATGVLVLGVERATKLLNYLVLTDKEYRATIRLGATTTTDDAEGEVLSEHSLLGLTLARIAAELPALTGQILQRPSSVSAIKVNGERAYARVRAGESVELAARMVNVQRFEVISELRFGPPDSGVCDVDVLVECSSGTYIRALARDLGERLGVGGHLSALRRTRVGPFGLSRALSLQALGERDDPIMLSLATAIQETMPVRFVSAEEARELSFGRFITAHHVAGTYGAIGADGVAVALLEESQGQARPVLGFTPAGSG